jgi:uncharacterized protein YecE (DUF72 family)
MRVAGSPTMTSWKIGCSGFHYAEWKEIFYPASVREKEWFEFYCRHFNTMEFNVTFYKFPRVDGLRQYHLRSPENYFFSVKAPRLITHFRKFKDAQRYLSDFYHAVSAGLQEKLGPVLFQFPANFEFKDEYLDRLISLTDKSFVNVMEFRHVSWWSDDVLRAFKANNLTFCGMSHPGLPDDVIKTSDTIYYRFHGVPKLYASSYKTSKLEQVAMEIQTYVDLKDVYVYFNNTADGSAISNAKKFQEICELVDEG